MSNSLPTSNYLHNDYYHILNNFVLNGIKARNEATQLAIKARTATVRAINAMNDAQNEINSTDMEGEKTEKARKLSLMATYAHEIANNANIVALQEEKKAHDFRNSIENRIKNYEFHINPSEEPVLLASMYSTYKNKSGQYVIGGKRRQVQNNRTNKRIKKRKSKTYRRRKFKIYRKRKSKTYI